MYHKLRGTLKGGINLKYNFMSWRLSNISLQVAYREHFLEMESDE